MKLKEWMKQKNISALQLSKEINYDLNYLYQVINENTVPGRKLSLYISRYTEGQVVPEDLGYKEKEKCHCPTCGSILNKK